MDTSMNRRRVTLCFTCPVHLNDALDEAAAAKGISKSDVVRMACIEWFSRDADRAEILEAHRLSSIKPNTEGA